MLSKACTCASFCSSRSMASSDAPHECGNIWSSSQVGGRGRLKLGQGVSSDNNFAQNKMLSSWGRNLRMSAPGSATGSSGNLSQFHVRLTFSSRSPHVLLTFATRSPLENKAFLGFAILKEFKALNILNSFFLPKIRKMQRFLCGEREENVRRP